MKGSEKSRRSLLDEDDDTEHTGTKKNGFE